MYRGHLSHWPKSCSVAAMLPRFKSIETDTKGHPCLWKFQTGGLL
jgi:hypothetical protein